MAPRSISMRELQKITASAIQALPHSVPIKSGKDTVGVLVPASKHDPERLRKVLADIESEIAKRTPEQQRAIDAFLASRGIEDA